MSNTVWKDAAKEQPATPGAYVVVKRDGWSICTQNFVNKKWGEDYGSSKKPNVLLYVHIPEFEKLIDARLKANSDAELVELLTK